MSGGGRIDRATGDATGLVIPPHAAALAEMGAPFLTDAFRAFGALPADNAVAAIERIAPCGGGSTGDKLFLTLRYEQPDPSLDTELFVKFSRDFDDPRRDWQRHEMASEALFAAITRRPGFPIRVPTAWFADYEAATGTGLVVTERVRFGEGGIEPHRAKCMDHRTLDDPLPYYQAILTALARLAGAHKAGRLAPDIDRRFPFDPRTGSADPIRGGSEKVEARLADCLRFAEEAPQLLPAAVRTPAFLARMADDVRLVTAHEDAIARRLVADPDYVALCHWNAHIDNAWFWREADGALGCGLIDWGRVGRITLGAALWGCLSAAHHDIWDRHLDGLLELFVRVYRDSGGPALTAGALKQHLTLHLAVMAVSRMLIFPEVIRFRAPDALAASGPHDPRIEASDPARNSLHIYTVLLNFWERQDLGTHVRQLLAKD